MNIEITRQHRWNIKKGKCIPSINALEKIKESGEDTTKYALPTIEKFLPFCDPKEVRKLMKGK